MIRLILLYAGSFLPLFWGIAHLFATAAVVRGFGALSEDNKRIITMEWIVEGVALIFIGAVVLAATIVGRSDPASRVVYGLSGFMLIGLAVISLFTGSKIRSLPFKLCPFLFTASAVLILAASLF